MVDKHGTIWLFGLVNNKGERYGGDKPALYSTLGAAKGMRTMKNKHKKAGKWEIVKYGLQPVSADVPGTLHGTCACGLKLPEYAVAAMVRVDGMDS